MEALFIYPVGETALAVQWESAIDPVVNNRVFKLYHRLKEQPHRCWKDIIPAYNSVTIVYDVALIREHHPSALAWARTQVEQALHHCEDGNTLPVRKLRIPVCYDAAFGLDLKTLAGRRKLSIETVISLHTQQTYRVYMLGFLPGFAYMGTVNKKIATPRLPTPRKHVMAGSVGIAGNQTGIYPLDSPGGWNIIGRTPVQLFNADREAMPVLFQPGDEVTFYSITKETFDAFDGSAFNPVAT